jgi:4-hydroxy-tetrahydrodipicolinate synthase
LDFGRLITAMVTPFDDDLKMDFTKLEKLIDYLIEEQQSDALVVSGTTGESPTLKDEEKLQLFEAAVKLAAGRCKIIAGTGSNETDHSVHLTRMAEKTGVDGILAVTPYYNKPSQEGVYRHFQAMAEVTDLPIMIYNIPGRTGINVTPETMFRLAEIPNIIASKESHCDLDHITTLVDKAPEGFTVYCGDDSLTLPYLSVGAYGTISVASHVIGVPMKEMIRAFTDGDVKRALAIHRQLFPVFKGLFKAPSPTPVKHALNRKGVDVGSVRLPLVPLDEEDSRFIDSLFL